MTHQELVQRAEKWLRNKFGCRVVLTEHVAYLQIGEIPDAVGWVREKSILVECKITKSDFLADRSKRFRRSGAIALGNWRFYLCTFDLRVDEIPEGWAAYKTEGRSIKFMGGVEYQRWGNSPFESYIRDENSLLVSALAKLGTTK
jgi:hypothetical protein